MKFFCNACDKERDFFLEYGILVITPKEGIKRYCRECRKPRPTVPDVYWDGKPEHNLADGPDGKPRVFASRGEKAAYLQSRGLMEAGDRVHGAPVEIAKNQQRKIDSRHEVQMALKKVRDMGTYNRRQEFLRITKEGQNHAKR